MSDSDDFIHREYSRMRQERESAAERDTRRKQALGLLLENEAVLDGMDATDAQIAVEHQRLTAEGKHVYPVTSGVTLEGDRVVVAEYADVPKPTGSDQEHRDAWNRSHHYSVYAYSLQAAMGGAVDVAEIPVTQVYHQKGSGIEVTLQDGDEQSHLHLPQMDNDHAAYKGDLIYQIRRT